jgi:hypothetical protein
VGREQVLAGLVRVSPESTIVLCIKNIIHVRTCVCMRRTSDRHMRATCIYLSDVRVRAHISDVRVHAHTTDVPVYAHISDVCVHVQFQSKART